MVKEASPGTEVLIAIWRKGLPYKRLEMRRCVISAVATAALVLKHQVTSNHSDD